MFFRSVFLKCFFKNTEQKNVPLLVRSYCTEQHIRYVLVLYSVPQLMQNCNKYSQLLAGKLFLGTRGGGGGESVAV